MDKQVGSISDMGRYKIRVDSSETQDSYLKAKEHYNKENPSQEEFDEFREYLLADESNWDGVERLFNEMVKESEEPSIEVHIHFSRFLQRNPDFRRNWMISQLEKMSNDEDMDDILGVEYENLAEEIPSRVRETLALFYNLKQNPEFRNEWIKNKLENLRKKEEKQPLINI